LRAPNLLTVPGDPWCGAAVVALFGGTRLSAWCLLLLGAASVCFYGFGLILNDLTDLDRDRVERPDRPLPSGAISLSAARRAAAIAAITGTGCALLCGPRPFLTSLCLVGVIAFYTRHGKESRGTAAMSMGLCRGFSLLLGASVAGWPAATVVAALLLVVYIGAVTAIAAEEVHGGTFRDESFVPFAAMTISAVACLVSVFRGGVSPAGIVPGLACLGAALYVVWQEGRALRGSVLADRIRVSIGRFLRVLVLWQCAYLFLAGGRFLLLAVMLLVCFPVNRVLAQRFSPT